MGFGNLDTFGVPSPIPLQLREIRERFLPVFSMQILLWTVSDPLPGQHHSGRSISTSQPPFLTPFLCLSLFWLNLYLLTACIILWKAGLNHRRFDSQGQCVLRTASCNLSLKFQLHVHLGDAMVPVLGTGRWTLVAWSLALLSLRGTDGSPTWWLPQGARRRPVLLPAVLPAGPQAWTWWTLPLSCSLCLCRDHLARRALLPPSSKGVRPEAAV